MPILTSLRTGGPTRLDNILTLALVAVLALVVIVAVIRKATRKKPAVAEAPAPVPVAAPVAPGSAGQLKLHNVDPKTAAMLMAIVADKLGKPINELRFISIKEVE